MQLPFYNLSTSVFCLLKTTCCLKLLNKPQNSEKNFPCTMLAALKIKKGLRILHRCAVYLIIDTTCKFANHFSPCLLSYGQDHYSCIHESHLHREKQLLCSSFLITSIGSHQ